MTEVKVIIADDHPVVRQGLRQMLAVEQDLTVVGEARNGQEVVELSRRVPWEVAVLDYNMPGKNGLELIVNEERVGLEVTDNGVGIADSDLNGKKSLGLLGMHERALLFGGEVRITGTPGHGTRVSVSIPVKQKA